MHGQYDWTGDPALSSHDFEWDTACPVGAVAPQPQLPAPHLHQHPRQGQRRRLRHPPHDRRAVPWHPDLLGNPVYAALLALLLPVGRGAARPRHRTPSPTGEQPSEGQARPAPPDRPEVSRQALKDYVLFPVLSGPSALTTLAGNATANVVRNVWAFTDHLLRPLPRRHGDVRRGRIVDESRGQWYYRQLLGSANLTGSTPVPPPHRQPQLPDRAPPLPRPPRPALPRHRAEGARDLRALTACRTTPAGSARSSAAWCARS